MHILRAIWAKLTNKNPVIKAYIPDGEMVFAVGDIHGCHEQLKKLLFKIKNHAKGFTGNISIIFIGDYIDRGDDSCGVLETLKNLPNNLPANWKPIFIRGNHEQALLDFLSEPKTKNHWLAWGGEETLESYNIPLTANGQPRSPENLAKDLTKALETKNHLNFLTKTIMYHQIGNYVFVHAGVRPNVPLARQLNNDLLFIREDFMGISHALPYRIVFGHTITEDPLITPDRIGIDTGAYLGGALTAVVLQNDSVTFKTIKL